LNADSGTLVSGKYVALSEQEEPKNLEVKRSPRNRWLPNMKFPTGRILYVEDDEDTRELVTYVLAKSDYKVIAAANGDDALMLARTNDFDLYVIDNWMSGGSGIDLCKKLREFDTRTPILFYSGAAYERDKQQAFAAGAQGYLIKPAGPDELIAEVTRIVSVASRTKAAAPV
jgi:DNA-binding response OmpR family regulator